MTTAYYYNGNQYTPRTSLDAEKGYWLATGASALILSPLAIASKPFVKQLEAEHKNNFLYKDAFIKSLETSGLKDLGVDIIHAQHEKDIPIQYKQGLNAAYIDKIKKVLINTDKISIAGFHELGHATNHLKSPLLVKGLSKLYGAGYAIAGLMEYFALFSRTKPKGAKRNISDVIEDNCGKIAFLAMLPVVANEALASRYGVKLAKSVRLAEPLIKNIKTLYKKALLTYIGRAVLGGLAVFTSRKIMDYYTRPKEIKPEC